MKKIGIMSNIKYGKYGKLYNNYFQILGCKIINYYQNDYQISKNENNISIELDEYKREYQFLIRKVDYLIINNYIYEDTNKTIILPSSLSEKIIITKLFFQSFKITKNILNIIYSLVSSYIKYKKYNKNKIKFEFNKLNTINNKILIIKDQKVNNKLKEYNNLLKKLNENNIEFIIAENLYSKKNAKYYQYFPIKTTNKFSLAIINAFYYSKNIVDSVLFITNNNCSQINNLKYFLTYYNNSINIYQIMLNDQKINLNEIIDIIKN